MRKKLASRDVETNPHQPVLLDQVVKYLAPVAGGSYLDLTAGYGGHACVILDHLGPTGRAILVDRDEQAMRALRQQFGQDQRLEYRHERFGQVAKQLAETDQSFDMVLMDLGVSSPQFDEAERGFSFRQTAELDMRMDRSQTLTAATIVNGWSEKQLAGVLASYGEEPRAKAIARTIVQSRPLTTTTELADLIEQTIRHRRGKIHPATRTFQAIRMAVNDELSELEQTLPLLPRLLKEGGRVVVISFHSLEDRLVKHYFKEASMGLEATFQLLTKRPIDGSTYDTQNPRARSAKLRAAVKINTRPSASQNKM